MAPIHEQRFPSQQAWSPPPAQAPVTEGLVQLTNTRLWCWDTGGAGAPVVLLHPFSGSHESWPYQQPVLAAAGYRVVGYSRRGHYRSDLLDQSGPGSDAEDLAELLDHLKIDRPHVIAAAAGGGTVRDSLRLWPDRFQSLVMASSVALAPSRPGASVRSLFPKTWWELPASLRELSASYRFAYPEGARLWEEIEARSATGVDLLDRKQVAIDPASLPPILAVTGEADASLSPPQLRKFAEAVPSAQIAVFAEAAHAVFWEQPDGFNKLVIDFLGQF
jgi:pimeloyl-ACP methyl ester carboxylesterase